MDICQVFDEKLVAIRLTESCAEDAIRHLTGLLRRHGYVAEPYAAAVLEREKEFPTGLPTEPFGVALPHADSEHVLKTGIAVGILSEPLSFRVMGSSDESVDVRLIFLMAIREPELLIQTLQSLAQAFHRPDVLERLSTASSPSEVVGILSTELAAAPK